MCQIYAKLLIYVVVHLDRITNLLWLLGLQGVTVWSVTVWAVMFTVVICCFGIRHNEKLLDVSLQKREQYTGVSSPHSTSYRCSNMSF